MGAMTAESARKRLRELADPAKAEFMARYFKTGGGGYGAGDRFIGVTVPNTRKVTREFRALDRKGVKSLLSSPIHEERLLALLILVHQFERGDDDLRKDIFDFYLRNRRYINNWDLVDASAHQIVGGYLHGRGKKILKDLARSKRLWDRRIAMVSTFHSIRKGDVGTAFELARSLLADPEDLMHKAAGWMLREAGKRDLPGLERFLVSHRLEMPRTMLRYAIEKFPEARRKALLKR
jgi:3-methyladenine DNA glycosylase AlkD